MTTPEAGLAGLASVSPWQCAVAVFTKDKPSGVATVKRGQVLATLQRGFAPTVTDKGPGEMLIDTRLFGSEWNWPIVVCFIDKKHSASWRSLDGQAVARMIDRAVNDPRARALAPKP